VASALSLENRILARPARSSRTNSLCAAYIADQFVGMAEGAVNHAVAVNVGVLREALSKVYHAHRIIDELTN